MSSVQIEGVAGMTLAQIQSHIADQPVDAKRIKGLPSPMTGQITSGATIDAGTGFTVSSGGTGLYTITFTTAFAATPTVVVTVNRSGGGRLATIDNASTTSVDVVIRTDGGVLENDAFHFVAYATV